MDRDVGMGKVIFDRSMAIIAEGSDAQALRAIDVVRDHWPEVLPPFAPRTHRPGPVVSGDEDEPPKRGG